MLPDQVAVVSADVHIPLSREVESLSPCLGRGEGVELTTGGVDVWEARVLAEIIVGGHDSGDHVVDTRHIQGAVVDSGGHVASEKGSAVKSLAITSNVAGHVHVQAGLNACNTRVGAAPVAHDIALETELALEESVLGLGVLAGI